MGSMPYTPTDTEKAVALSDVAYEVEEILGLLNKSPTIDVVTRNARLEVLLLHTRLLLDFFEHSRREKDNVLATDYDFPAKPVPLDSTDRDRLDKDLVHLTYSRLQRKGPGKDWDLRKLLLPVLDLFSKFAEHVIGTRLDLLPLDQRQRSQGLAASLKGYIA